MAAAQTVVLTGRGVLTEVGPLIEQRPPWDAPRPGQALPPPPTASWPHSYLGHCIPLWVPRSQRRVRLEGSERRVRSEVT